MSYLTVRCSNKTEVAPRLKMNTENKKPKTADITLLNPLASGNTSVGD